MTDRENIRLEVLKALINAGTRYGIEKSSLLEPAENMYDFVVKPPTKVLEDTPARETKKK